MLAQENILRALTEANANFAEFRREIVEANERYAECHSIRALAASTLNFSRAQKSLSLVTAYQIYVDVKEKTSRALVFYEQLFKLTTALDKGVAGMEAACKQMRLVNQ